MRSFFAQPDHIGVFRYAVDCLDFMIAMSGTSDRPCWLAESCKILLLSARSLKAVTSAVTVQTG